MYNVLIKGVGDKQLGELIAAIGTKKYSIKLTHYLHPNQEQKPEKPARVEPNDFIMLGETNGVREGSLPGKMLDMIRRYEVKNGAASMTRAMLHKKLSTHSDAPGAVITAGLARGIIKGVKNNG